MAVTKIKPIKSTLSKALDYIENPDKTDVKMLVSSFGCSYETADIEFEYTLSQALQKGNNLAFHLIQSFEPGEVDYQKAHEIGKQLADAVTKGQHEYVLTTHIDKGHVHNHIIFCAVNFVDHHKYNSNKRSYYGIRNMSDKLCRENGLSVVVPGKGSKGKSYAEYQAERTGTSWKGKLKTAVDALIPQVSIPDGALGSTWYGTTPEEADLQGASGAEVSIVNTGVAITRILQEHPVNINTFASEIVLPSFERMDEVAVLNVLGE